MSEPRGSHDRSRLEAEIERLRERLEDAEHTLQAITTGTVDPLAVEQALEEPHIVVLEPPRRREPLLVDRLRHAAITLAEGGEVLHANGAFAALVGREPEALVGADFRALVDPSDRATVELLLSPARPPSAVVSLLDAAGRPARTMRVACVPFAAGDGVCLIALDADDFVDEAHDTVRAIRRGEVDALVTSSGAPDEEPQVVLLGAAAQRYRLLVESSRDGAVTVSADGNVLYANPRFAAMVALVPSAIVGRRLADFFAARDAPLLATLCDERGGGHAQVEATVRAADGRSFRALVTPVRVPGEAEVSLLVADLTARNRLDEAEDALRAIASGEVDAFVVARADGDEVQTLTGAHRPYRLMVERMQQGAVTLSAKGEILYTNRPFATMLNRSLASVIGTSFFELVAEPDRDLLEALLGSQGAMTQGEVTLVRADGGRVPVLVAVALLPEEGGTCLMVTDLTRQKAYEAMVAAQALERSILEQAVDAIVLCDLDGRVTRASRVALGLAGGNPFLLPFETSYPLESPAGPPNIAAVLAGAATLRGEEYTLRRAGLVDVALLLSCGPITDSDGRVLGCVVTMTDITERREVENRLRESDRHKDEFLAILAHELRNPLAPIRSAVDILRSSPSASDVPQLGFAIDIIARQSANLIRLVDDLLDINRINQGKIELQIDLIDLRAVVEQAVETARPALDARRHKLEVRLPASPVLVRGDDVRLAQVIVNLVSNAAKYTPVGGHVQISLETSGGRATITVIDDGPGIAPEMLARIFEPYQQAGERRERAAGGLGLGLTVCRRLMQMHGGSVEAFSDGKGTGSRFVVRLSLANEPAAVPTVAGERVSEPPPLRVLICDDNRDAAEALAQVLELDGHRVATVADGAAAIAAFERIRPDLVLLDIGMPGLDGLEVARRLRALPGGDDARLVALTGYGSPDDRSRSLSSGIDHHLVKPLDLRELRNLLATPR